MQLTRSLEVLNSKDVKEIYNKLYEQFGIEHKFNFVFIKNNKDKIYVLNRDIENVDYSKLRIDAVGLYFLKVQSDGLRPSVEGAQILGPFCSKNVISLNREQRNDWFLGKDISVEEKEDRLVIVKYRSDVLGSGKIRAGILLNSLSKSRRLHVVNDGQ